MRNSAPNSKENPSKWGILGSIFLFSIITFNNPAQATTLSIDNKNVNQISNLTLLHPAPRIVGGSIVQDADEYPYFALLLNEDFDWFCGGTLIAANLILAAAHCVDKAVHARVGRNEISVLNVFKHPLYNASNFWNYDFGLLLLSESIENSSPVQLASSSWWSTSPLNSENSDVPLTVIGYGWTEENAYSDDLRWAQVSHVTHEKCLEVYDPYDISITEAMMCTLGDESDACNGDSGGPLLYKDELENVVVQVGVVSWGVACAHEIYPAVYAKVSQVYDWIEDMINLHGDADNNAISSAPSIVVTGKPTMVRSQTPSLSHSTFPSIEKTREPSGVLSIPSTLSDTAIPTVKPTGTPSSESDSWECVDIEGWLDFFGDDCGWYENEENLCILWGDCCMVDGHNANSACCTCGGGTKINPNASQSPSISVIQSTKPSSMQTNSPSVEQTILPSVKHSLTPSAALTIEPSKYNDTWQCIDVEGWLDVFGDDCSWYEREDNLCDLWGSCCSINGHNANSACCVCGGGALVDPNVSLPPSSTINDGVLQTEFTGTSVHNGIMFDVSAKETDILITSIGLHLFTIDKLVEIEIYCKEGTHVGYESGFQSEDNNSWILLTREHIISRGYGEVTDLVLSQSEASSLIIASNHTIAIYVTTTSEDEYEVVYSIATEDDLISVQDDNLAINAGTSLSYPFGTDLYTPRTPNVLLYYDVLTVDNGGVHVNRSENPTAFPTTSPTKNHSRDPTNYPTSYPTSSTTTSPSDISSDVPSFIPSTLPTQAKSPLPSTNYIGSYSEHSLTTSYNGLNQMDGVMFDLIHIVSNNENSNRILKIQSFDIHSRIVHESFDLQIYIRHGSHQDNERRPAAWQYVDTIGVYGQGFGRPSTYVGSQSLLALLPNERKSVFIMGGYSTFVLQCTPTNSMFDIWYSDDSLQILKGAGKRYYFYNTYDNNAFNGGIYYTLEYFKGEDEAASYMNDNNEAVVFLKDEKTETMYDDRSNEDHSASFSNVKVDAVMKCPIVMTSLFMYFLHMKR